MTNTATRRTIGASVVAFAAVGLLRGGIQLAVAPRGLRGAVLLAATTIAVSLFWVPVTGVVAMAWRPLGHGRRRIAFHVGAAVAAALLEPAWTRTVLQLVHAAAGEIPYIALLVGRCDTNLLMYAAIVAALAAAEAARGRAESQRTAARLDGALADARLHVLTLQLHPHFLFNTLNLVSQLAYANHTAARRTLGNLRALLVRSLERAGRRDVTLDEELRFLAAYLDIQQRRFGARLRVSIDVASDARAAAVPQLILQPLVENAIAHGIGNRARGGEIRVTARVDGAGLALTVEDDGAGLRATPVRAGVGLENTRLRLEQFSAGRCRLQAGPRDGGGWIVSMSMPRRDASTTAIDGGVALAEGGDETIGESPAPASDSPPPRRRAMAQIAGGWAAVAVLWTELDAATRAGTHRPPAWGTSLTTSTANATLWAALVLAIVCCSRRIDAGLRSRVARLAAHAGAALVVAAVHLALYLTLLRELLPEQYLVELRNAYAWALWDVVAYVAVAAFGASVTAAARAREANAAAVLVRQRLARARLASLRMHLQPSVLMAGLDAIDRHLSVDAARAERAIARMGDLLRLLLARADDDVVALDAELAALTAFLSVVDGNDVLNLTVDDAAAAAVVPAVLLTPIATSLRSVHAVAVRVDADMLEITLRSRNASLDPAPLDAVRARLNAALRDRWSLRSTADQVDEVDEVEDGASVTLRVPFVAGSVIDAIDARPRKLHSGTTPVPRLAVMR